MKAFHVPRPSKQVQAFIPPRVRPNRLIGFALGLTLVGAVSVALSLSGATHRQPTYLGRSARFWLKELGSADSEKREQAVDAVRHLETNALPAVLQFLRVRNTCSRQQLVQLAENCPWLPIGVQAASRVQDCGVKACSVLGPAAKPAISDLLRLLRERPSGDIAGALAATGLEVAPALISSLRDGREDARVWGAFTIGKAAALADHRNSTPASAARLDNPCSQPAPGLSGGATRVDFGPVVAALMENLEDQEPRVRAAAAWALGYLGEPARIAVPRLVTKLSDANALVRSAAAKALSRIDPAAQPRGEIRTGFGRTSSIEGSVVCPLRRGNHSTRKVS
jgi:HEAT repeats